jgi:hypothetical protein
MNLFRHLLLAMIPLTTMLPHAISANDPTRPPDTPTAQQVLASLRPGHPRLLATAEDFRLLRVRLDQDPQLQRWYPKLRAVADKMLTQAPSIYELPDHVRLLPISRRVLERTYTLALCYRLSGEDKYARRLWEELQAAAAFPDWHPEHFLDTAEMTHALAIGYDWLYDTWTPEQRGILRRAIVDLGLRPALRCYHGQEKYGWWVKVPHNWNQVCNGGIGIGALAVAEDEPALAGEILAHAVANISVAVARYGPDGGWAEGPGYWHYATQYTCAFLAALDTAAGGDFGLSRIPGVSDAGLFPIYASGPTGRVFNFADAHDEPIRSPELFWLAHRFQHPVYARWQAGAAAPTALDLLWYEPTVAGRPAEALPLDKLFHGVDAAMFRSAWDDPNALFVACKAGDNKSNHAHLDLGSFVLDALGERFVTAPGSDDYNLPGYWDTGRQRWTYYRLRAEGANTLVLDPSAEPDQDPKAAAAVRAFAGVVTGSAFAAYTLLDLTPAYARHATRVYRAVALAADRRSVLIADRVEADKPTEVWWFIHTAADIEIADHGRRAVLTLHGKRLTAELTGPDPAVFTVLDAAPLPGSPHPAGQNANRGIRKLAIHVAGVTALRLYVWLTPQVPSAGAPQRPGADAISALLVPPAPAR